MRIRQLLVVAGALSLATAGVASLLLFSALRARAVGSGDGGAGSDSARPEWAGRGSGGQGDGGALPVMYDVPEFSFVDQDGVSRSRKDLLGSTVIADFIFTRCTTACPVLTARMVLLQRALAGRNVRFVSFTVDPDFDTPAVLREYASSWGAESSRWTLLNTGTQEKLEAFSRGMKVFVAKNDDPVNPILHSGHFVLVDEQGRVRGHYDSNEESDVAALVRDAGSLAGVASGLGSSGLGSGLSGGGGSAESGARLFKSLGCLACHSNELVAPPLGGLAGKKVMLNDGKVVVATDAYLYESIVKPEAKVVAGYQPVMPNYAPHLSERQIADLVAYVRSLPATPGASSGPASAPATEVDPVCDMEVAVRAGTPVAEYRGRVFHFCSELCRKKFESHPDRYVGASGK